MRLYRRSYDAEGKLTGTVEYSFRLSPQRPITSFGWFVIVLAGAVALLWPLFLQPYVFTFGAAWVVATGWWCLLAVILLTSWLLPRFREANRQEEIQRRERAAKKRALGGRPNADLREVGQQGL